MTTTAVSITREDHEAIRAEIAELIELHQAAFPEVEGIGDLGDLEGEPLVLVAWDTDHRPIGYIVASIPAVGEVELWEHLVHPDHRHRGLGRRLLHELARSCDPGTGRAPRPDGSARSRAGGRLLPEVRLRAAGTRPGTCGPRRPRCARRPQPTRSTRGPAPAERQPTATAGPQEDGGSEPRGRGPMRVNDLLDSKGREVLTVEPGTTLGACVRRLGRAPRRCARRVEGRIRHRRPGVGAGRGRGLGT